VTVLVAQSSSHSTLQLAKLRSWALIVGVAELQSEFAPLSCLWQARKAPAASKKREQPEIKSQPFILPFSNAGNFNINSG
jgi:hypothetical protein